jgi:two-component system sensor histidine kinase RpfC
MRSSANTLLGLIENVLDISKIEAGKITISNEPFDLHRLINTIIEMQAPMGEAKKITVSFNINAATPFLLKGDEQHLKQVLINLIGNAIKFTVEGSVKLYISLVDNNLAKPRIRFEIQDTGIGIPEDSLSSIFDDFTQATSSVKQSVAGTGLGTTISKELVELMGGEIGVESKLDGGTTFWFELPFTTIPYEDLNLSDNHLLLLATHETTAIISPALETWSIEYSAVSSSARAFSALLTAIEDKDDYKTLMIDQNCMLDVDPIQFSQMIKAEPALENLSLILINTADNNQHDQTILDHFISVIPDPSNRRLLFNAIHASQALSFKDKKVVTLAEHYASKTSLQNLTILIAEDNRVNQQVLEGVLKSAGHQTLTADTGDQALDLLAEKLKKIDLLIVDMNMPGISGVEVIQALNYMDTSRRIPIIMLTADATPEAKKACLDAGANVFLTKPINSRALLEHIATLAQPNPNAKIAQDDRTTTSSWIDNNVINDLALLGDNELFLQQLIDGFQFDGDKHVAKIKNAMNDDYLTYRESLHALKGSAAEIGALKLATLCGEAEALKPFDIGTEKIATFCNQIESVFLQTIPMLHATMTKLQKEHPSQ